MTPQQQAETIELQRQVHAYVDNLIVAGMEPNVVVTAILLAATERVLRASTPTQTAAWLRGQALNVERFGAEMKAALDRGAG